MNISLPAASSSKQPTSIPEGGSADLKSEESGESKGFLQTLKDVFSSSDSESVENVDTKSVDKEGTDAVSKGADDAGSSTVADEESSEATESKSVESASTDASTDELLAKDSNGSEKSSSNLGEEGESESETKPSSSTENQPSGKAESASQATVAMSEGNKLLGQLDEANKTLQPTNGKTLPQAEEQQVLAVDAVKAQQSGSLQPQTTTPLDASGEQADLQSASNQIKSSGDAGEDHPIDRFIEKNTGEQPLNAQSQSQAQTQGAGLAQASPNEGEALQVAGGVKAANELQANESEMSQRLSAAGVVSNQENLKPLAVDPLVAESLTTEQLVTAVQTIQGQIVETENIANELLTKSANGQSLTQQEQELLVIANRELDSLNSQLEILVASETSATQEFPAESAIAWGAAQAIADPKMAVEAKASENSVASKAAQTGVAASVQQALSQNSASTASMNNQAVHSMADKGSATSFNNAAIDPSLVAAQSVQASAVTMAKAGSGDAMTKGGVAGAALLAGTQSKKEDSKESTLAQQIASASGQQGMPNTAPTRAEIQAQQQAPLQLTKELANEQVAEKVQMMMSKNLKNLDIRLDPPELGRMQIRMSTNNDVTNVHFTVSSPQAREVIEQTLPRLREMLAQQGIQLADSSVQQQASGQQRDGYANGTGNGGQSGNNSANDVQGDENLDADVNLELNVESKRDGISYYA
ncbi:flagellar hook-length control protein FliK [Vibrio makurazakiensis]